MAYYRTPHDVTALPAWQALQQHRDAMQGFSMREAFAADGKRFDQFSLSSCGLFLDYSKNLITEQTRDLLVNLAKEVDLEAAIKSMFSGEIINASEGRPVLHTALRRPVGDKLSVNGVNVMPEVHKVLNQITELVGRIHDGLWRGYSEKPITDVVNIGIGGSFLGPSWSPRLCCPTPSAACAATTWQTSTVASSMNCRPTCAPRPPCSSCRRSRSTPSKP